MSHPHDPATRPGVSRRPPWRVLLAAAAATVVAVGACSVVRDAARERPPGTAPVAATSVTQNRHAAGPAPTALGEPASWPPTAVSSTSTTAGSGAERPRATPSATPSATPAVALDDDEREVVELTNEARRAHGCGALRVDAALTAAARGHAGDMVERHYFAQTSPDGETHVDRLRAAGHPGGGATGENIALGQASAEAVVEGWMASPSHRANILDCSWTLVGVGHDRGRVLDDYSPGSWVQVFAAP